MDLSPEFGRALAGRYEIERLIGRGGMATVYLARDVRHARSVALKVLNPELGPVLGSARFLSEIRVTARLQHPHLLPLFDSGEAAGRLFYVMPYVRGESLRSRLSRESMPVDEAIRMACRVADGLEHAHQQGIVHRDLKPENILLQDGQPVVADFGIALAASGALDGRVTQTGVAIGTPRYMSPEQAAGERTIDARADIYALGAVLYEMIAGRPPHVADSVQEAIAKILTETPSAPGRFREGVPPHVDAAVLRALARNPADRWNSAAQFRRALEQRALTAATPAGGFAGDDPTRLREVAPARKPRAAARALLAVGVAVLLAIAGYVGWRAWGATESPITGAPGRADYRPRSLAVLPFENRSANADDEYFSDGLTEELLHQLAQTRGLQVAARTSSFAFKGRIVDAADVGRQLNVEALVSGSVRRAGDRLRITVQLVRVGDTRPIWSDQYERQASDAFRVQEEIARAIVARVGPEAEPPAHAEPASITAAGRPQASGVPPPNPEAFDLYLRGLYQWNRRTEEGARAAVDLLSKAVGMAPGYARAHGSLAVAYAVLGFYDFMPPREAFAKARETARHALALDPSLPEALVTLAYVRLYFDWDVIGAERDFLAATQAAPRYAVAHQWHANALTLAGRFDEAADAMRRAQELDPLAPIGHAALGWVFLYARDYAAAEQQTHRTLKSFPDYFLGYRWLAEALELQGKLPAALAAVDEALARSPDTPVVLTVRARILARMGRTAEARAILSTLDARAAKGYVAAYPRALARIALGEFETAWTLLEQAVQHRAHSIALVAVDPWLDPLRGDARFARLTSGQ